MRRSDLRYKNPKVAESMVLYHLKRSGIERGDRIEHSRKVPVVMTEDWVGRYQGWGVAETDCRGKMPPVTLLLPLHKRGFQLLLQQ